EYLFEGMTYEYCVVITPADENYPPYRFGGENRYYTFKMGYAEITANISTPVLTQENNAVKVNVDRAEIYYDGVSADDYIFAHPSYSIRYRVKGIDTWTQVIFLDRNEDGSLNASFDISRAEPDTVYEVVATIHSGNSHTMCYSDIVEICVNPTN
ncbi:MAG: hypothetical protein UHS52_06760, partial [Alistipes sp.]|nr:hypothetical protein [Alistipes sp.]